MILTLELLNSYLTYIFIFWRHRFQYLDRGEYPALKFEPDLTTYQSTYLDFYYSHEYSLLDITVLSKISENSTYNNIPKIFIHSKNRIFFHLLCGLWLYCKIYWFKTATEKFELCCHKNKVSYRYTYLFIAPISLYLAIKGQEDGFGTDEPIRINCYKKNCPICNHSWMPLVYCW